MGQVKIISTKPAKIFIDGKDQGTIGAETKEYSLENGTHEIYAKSAWCGSSKIVFEITEKSVVTLTLDSFKYENVSKAIAMVFVGFFMFTKNMVFLIIGGVIMLYGLYHVTIGKDKYLDLKLK